ncbi:MGMT family protein [Candidatus Peregrinibacteria bacterium]|nr:MGMT family protein [Candidatus Peregrinibacteria bacterium]
MDLNYAVSKLGNYGSVVVFWLGKNLVGMFFGNKPAEFTKEMQKRFPEFLLAKGEKSEADDFTKKVWKGEDVQFELSGSPLEVAVWQQLAMLDSGQTVSYTELAKKAGFPRAVRAVASAVGRNPISVLIPCHRVLRKDGSLGGYRFGLRLKKAILQREKIGIESATTA